jgi:hypothetical protein
MPLYDAEEPRLDFETLRGSIKEVLAASDSFILDPKTFMEDDDPAVVDMRMAAGLSPRESHIISDAAYLNTWTRIFGEFKGSGLITLGVVPKGWHMIRQLKDSKNGDVAATLKGFYRTLLEGGEVRFYKTMKEYPDLYCRINGMSRASGNMHGLDVTRRNALDLSLVFSSQDGRADRVAVGSKSEEFLRTADELSHNSYVQEMRIAPIGCYLLKESRFSPYVSSGN